MWHWSTPPVAAGEVDEIQDDSGHRFDNLRGGDRRRADRRRPPKAVVKRSV
jgi:hypothetical protein